MEDGKETNLSSEPFRVGGHFHQGIGDGTKQQVVECDGIGADQCVEFMREREHDMEVGSREEFFFACSEPALTGLSLALGTVAVSARVVRQAPIFAASGTGVDVAAQSGAAVGSSLGNRVLCFTGWVVARTPVIRLATEGAVVAVWL